MPPDQIEAAIAALESQLLIQAVLGANARVVQHAAGRRAELEADREAYRRAGLEGPAETLGQAMMLAGIGPAARQTDADFVELRAATEEVTPVTPAPAALPAVTPAEPEVFTRPKKAHGKATK